MNLRPEIYINLATAVCCLIFLLFLLFSYFSKKNMDNLENKIYRYMLITNLLIVISYSLFYLTDIIAVSKNLVKELYPLIYFISKIAPMFLIVWLFLLNMYLIIIINEKKEGFIDKVKKNEKKILKICLIAFLIIFIASFLEKSEVNLATGMEYKLLFVMNFFLIALNIILFYLIIKNGRKLPKKKIIPVYTILPLDAFSMLCGSLNINITLVYIIYTVINHLMYHTIENPDMKMIAQLELAKTQAEKSNKAKTDFLSSMSHELRTPLNAIVGLSQVLSNSDNLEDVRKDSNDILISSQNLLELVNGILDINKLEANEMELVETEYNPIEVINNVIKLIKIRINEKPLEIRTSISNELPNTLYGDKDKIRQILNNIMSNAVKYTEKGFIDVTISCNNIKDKCNLIISIRDTGRGISDEQKEKLFTKFNRLESDKDSDISGAGLGLAITKALVDLLDGKISVDSTLGMGTTFTITLTQKIINSNNEMEVL